MGHRHGWRRTHVWMGRHLPMVHQVRGIVFHLVLPIHAGIVISTTCVKMSAVNGMIASPFRHLLPLISAVGIVMPRISAPATGATARVARGTPTAMTPRCCCMDVLAAKYAPT